MMSGTTMQSLLCTFNSIFILQNQMRCWRQHMQRKFS